MHQDQEVLMIELQRITGEMDAIVDTYHAQDHPLPVLIKLRRDLAVYLYRLTAFIKEHYEQKAFAGARRKWQYYRELVVAMDKDVAAGKKAVMNHIEARTEALDAVLQGRKDEARADAAYDELRCRIDATKQVLAAMQQEIADGRHEKTTAHHQENH